MIDFGMRCHDLAPKGPLTEVLDAVKNASIPHIQLAFGKSVSDYDFSVGHYSAGFTLDTYTHVTGKMQLGAADKIGGFMDTAMPEKSERKIIPFERVV